MILNLWNPFLHDFGLRLIILDPLLLYRDCGMALQLIRHETYNINKLLQKILCVLGQTAFRGWAGGKRSSEEEKFHAEEVLQTKPTKTGFNLNIGAK